MLAGGRTLNAESPRRISRDELRDKIRGAWAGQMIGVSYGAPTEFRWLGQIIEEPIEPDNLTNAIDQDDLYVEMTFAEVMDAKGLDAATADYGEAFKSTTYRLWHANAAARRNLNRGIAAPMSGHPQYNIHADDIDFQIEADFIGIMCPGLPQASNDYCQRVGRVMNYGDGLYGGMFVAGMYAAAFFENEPRKVVEAGLAGIPVNSPYGQVISDVLAWAAVEPDDWRSVWRKIEEKWNKHDVCTEGVDRPFNIDAKLNGAYVSMGLLYGKGDWHDTMDVATRCGQDSDCNPASALGVVGAMRGYSRLPENYRREAAALADTKFNHTVYSLNDIVRSTETRALEVIRRAGGQVTESEVAVPRQSPHPPQLELWQFGVPTRVWYAGDDAWRWKGEWSDVRSGPMLLAKASTRVGNEVTLEFEGTGLALAGELSEHGGRADVYIDGEKSDLVAEAYIVPETYDDDLWRIYGLSLGTHTLRVVTRDDADPRSSGATIAIKRAVAYVSQ